MKRMVKWVLGIVIGLAVLFVGGAYLLPGEALVQRQAIIAAPPELVFPLINDLRRMQQWSPWAQRDRDTKYVFEGAGSGIGQKMIWDSTDPKVGKGSMAIVESIENRRVATALDFGERGTARASMELSPTAGGTGLTWGFKSELRNPIERWMGPIITRAVGDDYERGLARLKQVAESGYRPN